MEVQLKKAMENDLPQLLAICHAAAAADESTWDLNYPNAEILEEDIRGHRLYRITANGETAGLLAVGDFGELDMLSDPSDGPERDLPEPEGTGAYPESAGEHAALFAFLQHGLRGQV